MTTVTINDDGRIEGYLTVAEFAAKTHTPPGTVRQWANRGNVHALKILGDNGRITIFIKDDAEVKIHGHRVVFI